MIDRRLLRIWLGNRITEAGEEESEKERNRKQKMKSELFGSKGFRIRRYRDRLDWIDMEFLESGWVYLFSLVFLGRALPMPSRVGSEYVTRCDELGPI